jgi:hypothetical protein
MPDGVTPDQCFVLYEGDVELTQKEQFVEKGDGKIFLSLQPLPALEFELRTGTLNPPIFNGEAQFSLPDLDEPVLAFVTSISRNHSTNSTMIGGTILQPIVFNRGSALKAVQFRLINFHVQWSLILEAEGWKVSISPSPTLEDTVEHLKPTHGYAITHHAIVERSDGGTFTAEQADDILSVLFYFLSFARGSWVSPILTEGLDDAGSQAWRFWYPYRSDPWETVGSWFKELWPQPLSKVFPGFVQRWQNTQWRETLRLVLDWYIESNTQNSETSIIINQAAFELLSWVLLVEDKSILSRDGFDKLFASDKLRLLLSQSNTSLSIDANQVYLTKLARDSNWQDGPQALTEMRNRMVHPKVSDLGNSHRPKAIKNILGYPAPARAEAGQLGLWYLEKILLSLFGYTERIRKARLKNRYFEPPE